jgi:hypothetical protein
MVDAPCSRVGHIYRKFAPFPNPHQGTDFVGKVRCEYIAMYTKNSWCAYVSTELHESSRCLDG